MSNKPKIYATCPAGCLWETVHKEDFEKSATLIEIPLTEELDIGTYIEDPNGILVNTYISNVGATGLNPFRKYRLFDSGERNSYSMGYPVIGLAINGQTTFGGIYLHIGSPSAEYREYSTFEFLSIAIEGGKLKLVYEKNDERKTEELSIVGITNIESVTAYIYDCPKLLMYNSDAEIIARGEQGENGRSILYYDQDATAQGGVLDFRVLNARPKVGDLVISGCGYLWEVERLDDNNAYCKQLYKVKGENGANGKDGADGKDGVSVPAGGTAGQVLKKKSETDFDFVWEKEVAEQDQIVSPVSLDGAIVKNFYDADNADIVTGKYIGYDGIESSNATYMYFKVKLFSGKQYRINTKTTYSVAVFENGKVGGAVNHAAAIGGTQAFEIPAMDKKVVVAYISLMISQYNAVNGNVAIVEGTELPSGTEKYKFTLPWLQLPNDALPAYAVDVINFKQKLPPYLFDGIEAENYFDEDYIIANAVQDTQYTKYYHTPYIYLPEGTYTISRCYKYTPMSKDGVKGAEVLSGGSANSATFTVTEENPYISFMIYGYCLDQVGGAINGLEALRGISIEKGETATEKTPKTYKFNEKFTFKGAVGYYPTHWDGKKYAAIGDSITFGYAPPDADEGITGGSKITPNFAECAAQSLNMSLLNTAKGGNTVRSTLGAPDVEGKTNNYIDLIKNANFTPDVVTILLGKNDFYYVPLGTIDDVYESAETCTFYSGLSEIVRQLKEAFPLAMIVMLGGTKDNVQTGTGASGNTDAALEQARKDVAAKFDIQFFDWWGGNGFDRSNPTLVDLFRLDDIHPNHRAHKILGSRLTGFIASH